MTGRNGERAVPGLRGLFGKPTARAGVVVSLLWIGTAVLLRATSEFGPMIAILACTSVALWDTGESRGRVPRLLYWSALLAAVALMLWESAHLPGMLVLFGAAAFWFNVGEPLLRRGSRA